MTLYFEIKTGTTTIIGERTYSSPLAPGTFNNAATSAVNGKPFLVEVTVTDPAFDPATQIRTGPADNYDGAIATRIFSVRGKTAQETEDETESQAQDAIFKGVFAGVLYAAERAGDDITKAAVRQTAKTRAVEIYRLLP